VIGGRRSCRIADHPKMREQGRQEVCGREGACDYFVFSAPAGGGGPLGGSLSKEGPPASNMSYKNLWAHHRG
jgi:hypothetical protein